MLLMTYARAKMVVNPDKIKSAGLEYQRALTSFELITTKKMKNL